MRLKDRRWSERREELTTQPSWTNGWKHSVLPFVLTLAGHISSLTPVCSWRNSSTLLADGGQVGHKTAEFGNCCVTRQHKTSSLWCLGWKFKSYALLVNNLKFPWQTRQCFVSSPCIGRVPITIDEQAQRLQAFRNTWDVSSWPTSGKPG